MNSALILGVIGASITLVVIFELLWRQHLREKHAMTWAVVTLGAMTAADLPRILDLVAHGLGARVRARGGIDDDDRT